MNRKLPRPRDYIIGTLLLLGLAIPLVIAFTVIAAVYWTSRAIRALSTPTENLGEIS